MSKMAGLPVTTRGRPTVYACATMWHENELEMAQVITSLLRLDAAEFFTDQIASSSYKLEVHIFFDDAFSNHGNLNSYCKQLLNVLKEASGSTYKDSFHIQPICKYRTAYGGRIDWQTKAGNAFSVHLKDSKLVRRRKRWSQVLYLHYLLGWHAKHRGVSEAFVLTLDGDVRFDPCAVLHLLQSLEKDKEAAAVCGRTHPLGSGPIFWMQRFEYAVAHWFVKGTEDMLGGVLCAPGCFSLFRASALLHAGILDRFSAESTTAVQVIQCEQGEDRWLCSMLLGEGHRVVFNPCAHVYTHVPQTVGEFYHQRLRWNPTILPNTLEVLLGTSGTRRRRISIPFSIYLVVSVTLGLLDVGISVISHTELWRSLTGQETSFVFFLNIVIPLLFLLVCLVASDNIQIRFVKMFTIVSSALQITSLVLTYQTITALDFDIGSLAFEIYLAGLSVVVVGALHCGEWADIPFGIVYVILIPSMQIFRTIYTVCNFCHMAWGTRETLPASANAVKRVNGLSGCHRNGFTTADWTEELPQTHLAILPEKEQFYLDRLTSLYLTPKTKNGNKIKEELVELRNLVVLLVVAFNGAFIYSFYNVKIQLGAFEVSCSFLVTMVFYILMATQIVCILLHRLRTIFYCIRHRKKRSVINKNAGPSAFLI